MARKKPVILKSISFDTQTLAINFFHEMLQRYVPGEQLTPEDNIHVTELFKRHPNYSSKVGDGVKYFEIMPEKFNTQCFCAVLKNGLKEGFSYKKCITQKED